MTNHDQIRREMQEIQSELQGALRDLVQETGSKLKPKERAEIEQEFRELDELLERLKTGLVWVTLFGKTSVGKSAIANALMESDIARVGIQNDLTTEAGYYRKEPWMLVDVPGILGEDINAEVALAEARKAHGHIFVVNGEPYGPELKLFELVHQALPNTPKLVFVNQWDKMNHVPKEDRETVRRRIEEKMGRFVKSPRDIVYGSAQLYDPSADTMVRQQLPQLLDRLYEDAGTLGEVMNVLDPANRADELTGVVREKIMDIRIKLARKVITGFAAGSVVGGFLPFSQLLLTPGVLGSMVYTIFRVMGVRMEKNSSGKITGSLLKACAQELGAEFVAVTVAEALLSVGAFALLGPLGVAIAGLGNAAGLGYYRYRRTAILGEVTIEYIRNDCSWGEEGPRAVIQRAKERAMKHYLALNRKKGSKDLAAA